MFSLAGFSKTMQYIKLFKEGLICTVALSFLTVVFGFILALILACLRLSDFRPLKSLGIDSEGKEIHEGAGAFFAKFNPLSLIANIYVEVFRATPMLVQLFLIYYVVCANINFPAFKLFGFIRTDRFIPGVIALAMNSGAYLSEIIRSGINSIDIGQTEAARSLGLSKLQTLRLVILPQAIKNILPPIANEFVTIIKESSICYTIGVQDIMYAVSATKGATYRVAEPLIIATAIYFCLTFPTSKIIAYFERRMGRATKR